eukprot:6009304-Prymnesium_polylepis.3
MAGAKVLEGEDDMREKTSQDRGIVCYPFRDEVQDELFVAVCDGHGDSGEEVAEFAIFSIIQLLQPQLSKAMKDLAPSMKKAFTETNDMLRVTALR